MPEYPRWMAEVFASHMAYRPRSRPNFVGDIHHDVRDHMLDSRADTLAMWTGRAVEEYLAASRQLGISDDPVADSLEVFDTFDLNSLSVAHDYMAAYWRSVCLPTQLSDKAPLFPIMPGVSNGGIRNSLGVCLCAFRHWLCGTVRHDAIHAPIVIRRLCLVLVQSNTSQGILAEIDRFDTLREHYPIPRPKVPRPPS